MCRIFPHERKKKRRYPPMRTKLVFQQQQRHQVEYMTSCGNDARLPTAPIRNEKKTINRGVTVIVLVPFAQSGGKRALRIRRIARTRKENLSSILSSFLTVSSLIFTNEKNCNFTQEHCALQCTAPEYECDFMGERGKKEGCGEYLDARTLRSAIIC